MKSAVKIFEFFAYFIRIVYFSSLPHSDGKYMQ
ncbi:unknown [[Mannheimia] succiniciproducens MBEL55E]|uniref:Uncharacterized protein n=1 Tax=Mannheimia succiniciproducens (strain KCTC 0769BP / MBEL55E) TaxID=221988 RepID=Q65SP3_MANSM|nr:unknown [[Mannheimia] succiniciproducens MBEL55E]